MFAAIVAALATEVTLREERRYTTKELFGASGPTHMLPLRTGEWLLSDQHNHRVVQLTQTGGSLRPRRVIGQGLLEYPRGMAADTQQLFVADFGSSRVAAFRLSDGELQRWYGKRGTADDELMGPFACAVWSDELFVSDWGNNRIVVWDAHDERRHLRTFGPPADEGLPRAVDGSAGHLFGPAGIAVAAGRLFVAMMNNDSVAEFNVHGEHVNSFLCGGSEMNRPYGVTIVDETVIACAEFLGSRSVHLHTLDGDVLASVAPGGAGRLAHLATTPAVDAGSGSRLLVADSESNWVASLAVDGDLPQPGSTTCAE